MNLFYWHNSINVTADLSAESCTEVIGIGDDSSCRRGARNNEAGCRK